jgi:predicted O-linked N-acetylglucosamine transferase (SPINDLY family)
MQANDRAAPIAQLLASGHAAEAETAVRALRTRHPEDAELARLHGVALLLIGRATDAVAVLERGARLAPGSVEMRCNLASARLALGDAAGAIAAVEQALTLAPGYAPALNLLGNARHAAGDPGGARAAYRAALTATPQATGIAINLAAIELELGAAADAEARARSALAAPDAPVDGWLLLGHVLAAQGRHADAEAAYAEGARRAPQDTRFAYQTGLMRDEQGHYEAAATAYATALALNPDDGRALGQLVFARRQCADLDGLDALTARLRAHVAAGRSGASPFAFLAEDSDAAAQLACARLDAARVEASTVARCARLDWRHTPRAPDAPLRVGFVANGFHQHATAMLTVAFFEALREHVPHIALYGTSRDDGSVLRRRLAAAAHTFRDVSAQTAEALAQTIHDDTIEILIDLDGWCGGGRPQAFALRPAPLQVSWLAYPGSSGAPWIDYVIADAFVLPPSLRPHFSEAVAYLPRCYQPNDPTRVPASPPPRAALGLPDAAVVFACLNNTFKLNRASLMRFAAVLRAVPHSVLWLLDAGAPVNARLRAILAAAGVNPERVIFAARRPHAEYLGLYAHADLFLDSHPYNAHTTASDALWAGCPVLTAPGATFAARVGGSLNHHLGLDALNTDDDAAYIATAIRLGRDASARAALRAELAALRTTSPLFDMRGYAGDFAALLQRMAQRRRAGQPPADLG